MNAASATTSDRPVDQELAIDRFERDTTMHPPHDLAARRPFLDGRRQCIGAGWDEANNLVHRGPERPPCLVASAFFQSGVSEKSRAEVQIGHSERDAFDTANRHVRGGST